VRIESFSCVSIPCAKATRKTIMVTPATTLRIVRVVLNRRRLRLLKDIDHADKFSSLAPGRFFAVGT
jgi:hypothetical protein